MRTRAAHTTTSGSRWRRICVGLAMTAASITVPAGVAASVPPARPHPAPPSTAEQERQALLQARKTGRPVTVAGLTSPTSTTTATPRGTFVQTQTLQPVRVKRSGAWIGLDARLHRNADGSLGPNVTTSGLTISGGGTGPLATMRDGGVSLSLWWPTRLPVPVVHGASATYPDVLSGVDLVVTATPQGGFGHVLVIKTAAAAADPALAHLAMRARGNGVSVSMDGHGNLPAGTGSGAPPH